MADKFPDVSKDITTDPKNKNIHTVADSTYLNRILDEKKLTKEIIVNDIDPTDLIVTDNYNEEKLLNKLKTYGDNIQILFKCTLQIAIVGYGRKNYGNVRVNDQITPVSEIFTRFHIHHNKGINTTYNEDELSARRLLRLFRYQIRDYINKHKRTSYLWNKYANKEKIEFYSICFPGGEHLVETNEEAAFFYEVYGNLDVRMNTKFVERLTRIFMAKGIINPHLLIQPTINL
jgi:hypothetical protein